MVDYNLIEDLKLDDALADKMVREAFGDAYGTGDAGPLVTEDIKNFTPGTILKGRVVTLSGDFVIIDVGLKSEGQVEKSASTRARRSSTRRRSRAASAASRPRASRIA